MTECGSVLGVEGGSRKQYCLVNGRGKGLSPFPQLGNCSPLSLVLIGALTQFLEELLIAKCTCMCLLQCRDGKGNINLVFKGGKGMPRDPKVERFIVFNYWYSALKL